MDPDPEAWQPEEAPIAAEHGDVEARPRKRPRMGHGVKRVAEIVLVLETMARLRGGKKPTEVEVELMAEARDQLVELCAGVVPRDVAAKEAIGAVIEDLGLNVKEQKLGLRGPTLTISEKFSQWKKKMEESRKFPAQSTPVASQPFQPSINAALENHITYQPHVSSAGPTSFPVGRGPSATPMPVQYSLSSKDVKPFNPGSSNLGISALPRVDRTLLKSDGTSNVSPYASQGQVRSSNPPFLNTPTWSVHAQSAKSGQEQVKQTSQTFAKVDSTAQSQPAAKSFPIGHQPLQPSNFPQPPPHPNAHNDISKIVQKLLQPKLHNHPIWIPPSRDYMTKALTCQICHITVNDVNSVLICDACEKGYHTKCVMQVIQNGIPKGEWHCSRCLALSNGKPLPPKYGRVMRSNTPVKLPSAIDGEKKANTTIPKANQQKVDPKNINNVPAKSEDMVEKPVTGISEHISLKSVEAASASSTFDSSDGSSHAMNVSEPLKSDTLEPKPSPLEPVSETIDFDNEAESSRPADEASVVDQSEIPNDTEFASVRFDVSDAVMKEQVKPLSNESNDIKREHVLNQHSFEWIGDVIQVVDGNSFYRTCRVNEVTYQLEDLVLLQDMLGKQSASTIKSMFEESKNGSKWLKTDKHYIFPSGLPEHVSRPSYSDDSEVYEIRQEISLPVEHIYGHCEILPLTKYEEESERRKQLFPEPSGVVRPIYICKWLYDEAKESFQPVSG